ncbi:MAG TPA: ferritin [Sedimentisphaerales bacterium]|nr:ferritin [Sedimentisphaerales bacterium]
MISEKVQKAFNKQLNAEIYSAYLYLSMASYFQSNDLPGFANWMRVQEQEERFHALKFYDYILARGGKVTLTAIETPPDSWKDALDVIKSTLVHEQKVTSMINDLVYLARDEKDNASEIFLQWYVSEQVEEEDNVNKILGQLKIIKDAPQALFLLDKELGLRVFTPPTTAQGA